MSATPSRHVRELLLDGSVETKFPFEEIGGQLFLKYDQFTVKPSGKIVFTFKGRETFTIEVDSYNAGDELTVTGVEGRMKINRM